MILLYKNSVASIATNEGKMSSSASKAHRWVLLERFLARSPKGISVMQLAQKLDVHRATIYRDIDELSRAGLPIWQAKSTVGILTDCYLLPLPLNIYEALSLFIATRLLGR